MRYLRDSDDGVKPAHSAAFLALVAIGALVAIRVLFER